MLNQSGDTKPTEGNDEADMVQRLPGERAQKQHAEVESALMNLKRHIGQLMTVSNISLYWSRAISRLLLRPAQIVP
jgi:hypothetical protein